MTPSPSVGAEIEVPSTSSVSTPNERAQTAIKSQQQNPNTYVAEVHTLNEAVPASIPVFTAEVVPSNTPQPVHSPAPALPENNAVFTPSTNEALAE
jgi:hypothetical protein